VVLALLAWNLDPFNRRQRAETKAANAVAQSKVTETVARAADTFHTETIVIRERADRAVQTVQKAPGAGDAIDPAVLAAWADGLRDITAGAADRDGADKP
jgi:hypothetical protein